jgi:hypothetical protein
MHTPRTNGWTKVGTPFLTTKEKRKLGHIMEEHTTFFQKCQSLLAQKIGLKKKNYFIKVSSGFNKTNIRGHQKKRKQKHLYFNT